MDYIIEVNTTQGKLCERFRSYARAKRRIDQLPADTLVALTTTGGSPNCTVAAGTETCTVPVSTPPGSVNYTFTIVDGSQIGNLSAGTDNAPSQARLTQLATIVLGPHVQHLPKPLREPFMDEVMAELGTPVVVDYVRLNADATA